MLAVLLFCSIILYVEFIIFYFARSLFSISLHAVVCAICKASLFHILILQLLLLCTVKPVHIGHAEDRTPPNRRYFCLEQQVSTENKFLASFELSIQFLCYRF